MTETVEPHSAVDEPVHRQHSKGLLGAIINFFVYRADKPLLTDKEEIDRIYRQGRIRVMLASRFAMDLPIPAACL